MSSTNKTSLGLNMWEASDKPVRQDFINDNVIIDEKITKLNSSLEELNNNLNSKLSNLYFKNWEDAILLEGWTGNIAFGKTITGQVAMHFVLGTGSKVSEGTVISVLPQRYWPVRTVAVPVFKSNMSPYDSRLGMYITSGGHVTIRGPLTDGLVANAPNANLTGNIIYFSNP